MLNNQTANAKTREQVLLLLKTGFSGLQLAVNDDVVDRLVDFLFELQRWNQRINLTAITNLQMMVTHHVLDSVSIARWIAGENFLDAGTGAGLPGIPLAMLFPNKLWVLLDSRGKKIDFVRHMVMQLGLRNVDVVQSRLANYHPSKRFDGIIFRAVGKIVDILPMIDHLIFAKTRVLFMKGQFPDEEINALDRLNDERENVFHYQVVPLSVPSLHAKRHLVIVKEGKCN